MTDFDKIRNIMICFEDKHHDKTKALNDIVQVCFGRDLNIKNDILNQIIDENWDMK